MAAAAPPSMDYWRGFFSGARASIFDTIDAAIRVAAADNPDGLRAERDAIAHRLFTVLPPAEEPEAAMVAVTGPPPTLPEGSVPSLCSSDGAAVANRRDIDDPVTAEVFRVKAALSGHPEMSEEELLELLRRLQQLKFTVDTIKVTEIGKAVKQLQNHGSKQIRQLVRSLIEGWQSIVTEWMSNEAAIVDHTPQSMDASCLEQEGGLPSPPMDEDALFATMCSSMQLSEFFDEMDDDGNLRTDAKECEQQHPTNQESTKNQPPVDQQYDPVENWRLDESAVRQSRLRGPSGWQTGQQSVTEAQEKPSNAAFGPGRPHRLHSESEPICSEKRPKRLHDISVAQTQRRSKPTMPNQPSTSQHDQSSFREKLDLAKNAKLKATKRKLQEGYQEFKNAKQQRTMQMVATQDLPKQGNRGLRPNGKVRNNGTGNIRNRLGVRR
uniref:Uncharacterized protein n=1 Tax=Avena sativa TaxID=4498 RepID=A0ACD5YLD1_AVESA